MQLSEIAFLSLALRFWINFNSQDQRIKYQYITNKE